MEIKLCGTFEMCNFLVSKSLVSLYITHNPNKYRMCFNDNFIS